MGCDGGEDGGHAPTPSWQLLIARDGRETQIRGEAFVLLSVLTASHFARIATISGGRCWINKRSQLKVAPSQICSYTVCPYTGQKKKKK